MNNEILIIISCMIILILATGMMINYQVHNISETCDMLGSVMYIPSCTGCSVPDCIYPNGTTFYIKDVISVIKK